MVWLDYERLQTVNNLSCCLKFHNKTSTDIGHLLNFRQQDKLLTVCRRSQSSQAIKKNAFSPILYHPQKNRLVESGSLIHVFGEKQSVRTLLGFLVTSDWRPPNRPPVLWLLGDLFSFPLLFIRRIFVPLANGADGDGVHFSVITKINRLHLKGFFRSQ